MYRENNFWQWLGAFSLGLIAAINNSAFLLDAISNAFNWSIQSGFLMGLTRFLERFFHLIEFTFRHFGWVFFVVIIWQVFYARNNRF